MERPVVERWAPSPAPAGLIPRATTPTPAGQTLLGFFVLINKFFFINEENWFGIRIDQCLV